MADNLLGNVLDGRKAIQRRYHFEFVFPFAINGIDGTIISSYCEEVSFGEYSISTLSEVRLGPFKQRFGGLYDIDTITARYRIPIPNIVSEFFKGWRQLQVSDDGIYSPKNRYSMEAYFRFYNAANQLTANYKLEGLFVKTMPKIMGSHEREEIVTIEVELNVDKITY